MAMASRRSWWQHMMRDCRCSITVRSSCDSVCNPGISDCKFVGNQTDLLVIDTSWASWAVKCVSIATICYDALCKMILPHSQSVQFCGESEGLEGVAGAGTAATGSTWRWFRRSQGAADSRPCGIRTGGRLSESSGHCSRHVGHSFQGAGPPLFKTGASNPSSSISICSALCWPDSSSPTVPAVLDSSEIVLPDYPSSFHAGSGGCYSRLARALL